MVTAPPAARGGRYSPSRGVSVAAWGQQGRQSRSPQPAPARDGVAAPSGALEAPDGMLLPAPTVGASTVPAAAGPRGRLSPPRPSAWQPSGTTPRTAAAVAVAVARGPPVPAAATGAHSSAPAVGGPITRPAASSPPASHRFAARHAHADSVAPLTPPASAFAGRAQSLAASVPRSQGPLLPAAPPPAAAFSAAAAQQPEWRLPEGHRCSPAPPSGRVVPRSDALPPPPPEAALPQGAAPPYRAAETAAKAQQGVAAASSEAAAAPASAAPSAAGSLPRQRVGLPVLSPADAASSAAPLPPAPAPGAPPPCAGLSSVPGAITDLQARVIAIEGCVQQLLTEVRSLREAHQAAAAPAVNTEADRSALLALRAENAELRQQLAEQLAEGRRREGDETRPEPHPGSEGLRRGAAPAADRSRLSPEAPQQGGGLSPAAAGSPHVPDACRTPSAARGDRAPASPHPSGAGGALSPLPVDPTEAG
eukprot:TRINITY_DN4933_c0_g1_i1.p1 TRINITY_DN4933_c0_g1~~TRINITY_DN4933_c0_g1_i1.p1  ORF type:complete len:479 (+),score=49.07 TRINITY_DN4933_c0_g1_i1:68-1504(+)